MNTTTRREISQRATALGLAALMSATMLGSIEMLAAAPAPAGLLARITTPAQVAAAPAPLTTAAPAQRS